MTKIPYILDPRPTPSHKFAYVILKPIMSKITHNYLYCELSKIHTILGKFCWEGRGEILPGSENYCPTLRPTSPTLILCHLLAYHPYPLIGWRNIRVDPYIRCIINLLKVSKIQQITIFEHMSPGQLSPYTKGDILYCMVRYNNKVCESPLGDRKTGHKI